MRWNDSEFLQAIRLIRKFFPESKSFIREDKPLSNESLVAAMSIAELKMDFSCDDYGIPEGPDLGFRQFGGFEGSDVEIYQRILKHTGFLPKGRVVFVPDCVEWSKEDKSPFVCHVDTLPIRIGELEYLFYDCNDSAFVYESGEAVVVDHDNRLFWAKSKI